MHKKPGQCRDIYHKQLTRSRKILFVHLFLDGIHIYGNHHAMLLKQVVLHELEDFTVEYLRRARMSKTIATCC